jgi:hypothetical protein
MATATRGILLQGHLNDGFPYPWLVLVWSSAEPRAGKIETAHPLLHVDPIVDCEGFWALLGTPVFDSALGRPQRAKP